MAENPLEEAHVRPLGLFGNPVGHSFSPLFMNHAIRLLGLHYRYLAFTIDEQNLETALQAILTLGFRGVNITIPFKRAVLDYLDRIDEKADRIGAVNCIVNDGGLLMGYNTDHLGFMKPLRDRGISVQGRAALIIGSGGAARAVVTGFIDRGIAEIAIVNRTEKHALSLIQWCTEVLGYTGIAFLGDGSSLASKQSGRFDLIVNTTPVGMYPHVEHLPLPDTVSFGTHQTVYDLIYNPWNTRLLEKARGEGASIINGFEMLILQGLYSLSLWFPERTDEIFDLQEEVVQYTREKVRGT